MATDESQPRPPRSLWPIFLGSLIMLGLFLGGAKLLLMLGGPAPDPDAARSLERREAYANLQKENTEKLGQFAWADQASQRVQIPIELAMRIAAERLAATQPHPFMSAPPPPATTQDSNSEEQSSASSLQPSL